MTTLAIMKARIATEVRRANVSVQIADAINSAIAALEDERFYFDESRENTFATVAHQAFYTVSDAAFLGRLQKIDFVFITIGGQPNTVLPMPAAEIERLSTVSAAGQPTHYCWYGDRLRLYPIPTDVFTVRIGGVVRVAAPADDAEAANPWMTTAERLVRCRAKYELYEHVIQDEAAARTFNPRNDDGPTAEAFRQLRRRSNERAQQGGWVVTPVDF